jgi:hypothetical protein
MPMTARSDDEAPHAMRAAWGVSLEAGTATRAPRRIGQGLRFPSRVALPCTCRRDFGQAFRMVKLAASGRRPGNQNKIVP